MSERPIITDGQRPTILSYLRPSLNHLLIFLPVSVVLHWRHSNPTLVFFASCLAIVPLAGIMGKATEQLAEKTGEGIGGLLNATFGNAAEMIIAIMALSKGLHDVVKASLTGSIIGNILLVLGISFVAGGIRREKQQFNPTAASTGATMLTLAAVALIAPAFFAQLMKGKAESHIGDLSLEISVVLLATYGFSLLFSLRTHKHLYVGNVGDAPDEIEMVHWGIGKAIGILLVATAGIAWMSELLVGAVEHTTHALGLTEVFVGVIVVAIVGNAAEHSTAVWMATKDRMDLALSIAIGSSTQIALFVAPVLVFVSYLIGRPMNLVFTTAEVMAVALSVIVVAQISQDGESNWLEGVQLLSVYAIMGIVFFYLR